MVDCLNKHKILNLDDGEDGNLIIQVKDKTTDEEEKAIQSQFGILKNKIIT